MTDFFYSLNNQPRKNLGLVVLQSDETVEQDFRRLIPNEASFFVSRVPSGLEVTRETLREMENHIPAAAKLFPRSIEFDALGYGCTSGTSVIGSTRVADLVRQGTSARNVTEPVSALIAACKATGVTQLAFLSPYVESVSAGLRKLLAENGVNTPVFGSFNEAEEAKVALISGKSIVNAAVELAASQNAEAIFLSCTNLPTLDVIEEIEMISGKPVFSSNQVLAWHMCRLANIRTIRRGFGRLLAGDAEVHQ